MNPKKHMIIIKSEIQTSKVKYCNYNTVSHKMEVVFNNGEMYPYSYLNVEWLKEPKVLDPNMYQISRDGHDFFDVQAIYAFEGQYDTYWHICFGDGSERDYCKSDLKIVESCLNKGQSRNVFEYIKRIASLSNLRNDETGEKLLSKRFDRISFVGDDVVLAKYLDPSIEQKSNYNRKRTLIFPFGCNNSQYQAVKNAMENQISVIQGPPGTGKTQTILNIIANILMQGKTVQIVSNNNSATENVYEKLSSSKYGLGFLAATLGSSKNKKAFIDGQDSLYPDFTSWKLNQNRNISLNSVYEKSAQLKDVFDKQEQLANLKQDYSQLKLEIEYFHQYAKEMGIEVKDVKSIRKLVAKQWIELWQKSEMFVEKKQKINFWFIMRGIFQYGIWDFQFYKQDVIQVITTFQAMYYQAKEIELSTTIREIEGYLKNVNESLLDDLCNESMMLLKDRLAARYQGKENRTVFGEDDLWQNPYNVLEDYPVILSTTFSSRNSLNENVIYDYIIMDEASQVDVATGALAMSCARNAVIVGDTKQLPNVVTEDTREKAGAIFSGFNIHEGYQFTKSFLQSVLDVMPNVKQTLLREHYRCHPKIINFCNQKFYRGELIIMTEDKGEEDVMVAVRTAPGNHVRDHYSQRQIDVIKNEIVPRYVTNAKETGIIAPYKNQVEALEKEFMDIEVATVHKFQGKEKDTIIISTVDDEITDFADDPYLINVAVSRAKKNLMLVVTGNKQSQERNILDLIAYIQYNNFEATDSKVNSVFDYLYKQYEEERRAYLQKHRKISEYDSENLMHGLIEEVLAIDKYASFAVRCHFSMNMLIKNFELLNDQERKYAMNPATHIDFLLYNRISKKPVLAVEVDGYDYHKEDTEQAKRDLLKNHILELYEIPLLRFKTNGSGEKEMLINMLDEIVG